MNFFPTALMHRHLQMPCHEKSRKFSNFRLNAEARTTVLLPDQQAKKQLG